VEKGAKPRKQIILICLCPEFSLLGELKIILVLLYLKFVNESQKRCSSKKSLF